MSADATAGSSERRTSSVELLWDLVFVFAVTQVTTLLSHHLVAGMIIFAAGVRLLVRAASASPPGAVRLALCAGAALYLVGNVLFAARLGRAVRWPQVGGAIALLVLYAAGGGLAAWPLSALLAAILVLLCLVETLRPWAMASPRG